MGELKMQDKWVEERIAYIRGLKSPNEHQQLLVELANKPKLSTDELRKLSVLVRAEKAAEKAQKAKASAARIVNAEKKAERKKRDRELYQSAGLLILAGLVDTKTGKPNRDKGELLGALISLAESDVPEERRAVWKAKGDAVLQAS